MRPLSVLLSQTLASFTVEFDNEFERRMAIAGHAGARLSLVLWSNLMRFVPVSGVSVAQLAARALAPRKRINFQLGCLERWGFIDLHPTPHARSVGALRDGWGSGRGIRSDWIVLLTFKGLTAAETWNPLAAVIEQRWLDRFGAAAALPLREALQEVAARCDRDLPHALPVGFEVSDAVAYPTRLNPVAGPLPLPALLSQLLLAFTIEFDGRAKAPLALSANAIRVLGKEPVRAADLPRLTGGSPETSGLGWQLKPYVVVETDKTARRGKTLRLTPLGLKVQQNYRERIAEIETRWASEFGRHRMDELRAGLQRLFELRKGDGLLLSEGLVPPPGVARAAHQVPALGRERVAAAARQRMRDLVAQTEAFVRDPIGTLPHYPLWDANRGFGL